MSNGAPKDSGLPALEAVVGRALEEMRGLRERAAAAAQRAAELEALLGSFQSGGDSPERMKQRLDLAQAENQELRARVGQALETVERLLARVRYLEDQK